MGEVLAGKRKGMSSGFEEIMKKVNDNNRSLLMEYVEANYVTREKYMEMELKIKQLEIELKSMKELNSHLKIFLKKKTAKSQESANDNNDTVDLTAKEDSQSSKSSTKINDMRRSTGSSSSEASSAKKRKGSSAESNGRLKKRLVAIYGDSGLKEGMKKSAK